MIYIATSLTGVMAEWNRRQEMQKRRQTPSRLPNHNA